jgi:hypothetical protein
MPSKPFDLKRYLTKLAAGEVVAAPSSSTQQKMILHNRLGSRRALKAQEAIKPEDPQAKVAGIELNMPVTWTPPTVGPKPRRRKKKTFGQLAPDPGGFMTSLGLSAGLGGLGAYAAGKTMLGDEARGKLTAFTDAAKKWPSMDPRQVAREYPTLGHEAVNQKVWRMPIGKVVPAARSQFDKSWTGPGSARHYNRVVDSTGAAYNVLLEEAANSKGRLHQNLLDAIEQGRSGELLSAQKTVDAETPESIGSPAYSGLQSLLNDIGAANGQPVKLDALRGDFVARMTEMQRRHLERHGGDNLRGLDEFVKTEDPELWKAKQVMDYANGRHIARPGGAGDNYAAAAKAGLKAQDTLKTWGKRIGLAGAGAVGVGVLLTLLRNAIEERRRKREEEEDAG